MRLASCISRGADYQEMAAGNASSFKYGKKLAVDMVAGGLVV
jgi:hypothetical protein